MQRLGVRFEVTEAILNHVSGSKAGVAGVYQLHDWGPEKKAALIGYLKEAMARVDDKRVYLLAPTAHQPGDAVNGHPTTAQHAVMAAELLPQLRRITGW